MNSEYTLYLDMDGVIVDYQGAYASLAKTIDWKGLDQEYWEELVHKKYGAVSSTPEWWASLDWIEGGREVWKVAHHLFKHVCILSSASSTDPKRFDVVAEGKRQWLKKHMPQIHSNDIFIVQYKGQKKNYANKTSILVDDVTITIKDWNASGGFGILHSHKHYKETIETLMDIAAPLNLSEIVKRLRK
jgi:hypothetical protein